MSKVRRYILRQENIIRFLQYLKRVTLPGFGRVPIYYVVEFFFKGISEGYVTTRAAAVAFSLFIALFPSIIFLFSLIPYIPIENFQQELILEIMYLAPDVFNTFLESTIFDIIENQNSGVLSFGFILALYFSTNGINSMLSAFSMTFHHPVVGVRTWLSQQLTAIWITLILAFFFISGIVLTIFGEYLTDYIFDYLLSFSSGQIVLITVARWIIIVAFIYFSIAFIYYYGPKKEEGVRQLRFFSPGATLATVVVLIFTILFSLYLTNFNSYNKLYGSIGTVMGVMILIYLNCIAIIIGFELNASIKGLKNNEQIDHLNLPTLEE